MIIKKIFFPTVCFASLLLGLFIFIQLKESKASQFMQQGVFLLETPRSITPFKLINHEGQPFTEQSLKGQWQWIFFGFTHCPDICPATLATLKQAMKKLDNALQVSTNIVLVSVDPARDTVDKMKQYVGFFGQGVTGVTGDFIELLTLTNNLSVPFKKVMLENGDYTVDHSGYVYLTNPDGQYIAFFKPPLDTKRFAHTYTTVRDYLKE